jgi:acetoacetyl-CoA synthetase
MARFLEFAADQHNFSGSGYLDLHRWSIEDLDRFWSAHAEFWNISFSKSASITLGSPAMPGAEWFPGAEVSYVEHVFRGRDAGGVAILAMAEGKPVREVTWGELAESAAAVAVALREAGVQAGDRVAAYLPNAPETIAAFLGAASIGAIWSSCSPDFGAQAAIDRLGQIEPTVLIAADGYRYGGEQFSRLETVAALRDAMPSLRETVLLPFADPKADLDGTTSWQALMARGAGASLEPLQLPFEHPLWILYSSGTTGLPKGIVHSQGGILLEHLKWAGLQTNLGPGDRMLWLTTTGWMMWNFVVGVLLTGATAVLYEGNFGYPDLGAIWRFANDAGATVLGAGASFYERCMKSGISPGALESLRAVGSTGSPLSPECNDWIYKELEDVWLFSTSGGTDVCTAFVGGTPLLPVRRGELQAPHLGVDLQAWDEGGRRLPPGEVGELVVAQPMPTMPVSLWNDPDGTRLRDTYFAQYPGVWRHGDWLEMTESGGAIIHGRSDSTINRGGVRIGTAEIYRAVATVPEVVDALVVDVPDQDGESWVPLFVVLADDSAFDDELVTRIKQRIAELCSHRHVPTDVLAVPALPRTLSGKLLEVPVKRVLMGEDPNSVASRDSLAAPDALNWFEGFAARARTADNAGMTVEAGIEFDPTGRHHFHSPRSRKAGRPKPEAADAPAS